jgi:hypothetical protein
MDGGRNELTEGFSLSDRPALRAGRAFARNRRTSLRLRRHSRIRTSVGPAAYRELMEQRPISRKRSSYGMLRA